MFIRKVTIQNFRLISAGKIFELDNLNVPDNSTEGSGINLIVGENSCGKTTLLDALSLPLLSYKAESFSLDDFNNPKTDVVVEIFSEKEFDFDGTMPSAKYKGKGFSFEAKVRARENKAYLSSTVVSDQKFLRADHQTKPVDGSTDLRINVNNPFKGSRFSENDVLFLDRNRTHQIRSGTYSSTRFDRLMEDFDYQYIKKEGNPFDINKKIEDISADVKNDFLVESIEKFKEISGYELSLLYLRNWNPHKKAFLGVLKDNLQQISLDALGSGYEMIFSLLYSFYLSKQSKKQLIILIDEPELHLHPKLQEDFVKILLEYSKTAQVFLTTHSPLFVKQLLKNEKVQIDCIKKVGDDIVISKPEERVLSYISANEINFIAFGLATEEYHNELYNELEYRFWSNPINAQFKNGQVIFDNEYFSNQKNEPIDSPFMNKPDKVTKHTYIRNKIHHSKENGGLPTSQELCTSILKLRTYF